MVILQYLQHDLLSPKRREPANKSHVIQYLSYQQQILSTIWLDRIHHQMLKNLGLLALIQQSQINFLYYVRSPTVANDNHLELRILYGHTIPLSGFFFRGITLI